MCLVVSFVDGDNQFLGRVHPSLGPFRFFEVPELILRMKDYKVDRVRSKVVRA